MELRQKTNNELLALYEGELVFHHSSARGIHETKRVLNHFHNYLGEFPPTPELAKSFLSQFKGRKPTTIARYAAILKVFFKWYGEELDIKIKVPKVLPSYVEESDIEKLLESIKSKRSHKETVNRDILLVDLAIHTGLRRSELAGLRVGDIDMVRQLLVVRQGKGSKDRVIPLSKSTCEKLAEYVNGKNKDKSLFALAPTSISGRIRIFANKAGVKIHTHSLRDYFATSLSEKGATIREIQSLLGHTNLTHTERYTLHTDKHLKDAIDFFDKKPEKEQALISESKILQEPLQLQPIVILKVIEKKAWPEYDNRINQAVKTLEEIGRWLGRDGFHQIRTKPSLGQQLFEIFRTVRNRVPKRLFLSRWYPDESDEGELGKANLRKDMIGRTLDDLREEGIDIVLDDPGTETGATFPIHQKMYEALANNDIILVDLSGVRANVCVEAGYALERHKSERLIFMFQSTKRTKNNPKFADPPFDLSDFRYERIKDTAEIIDKIKPHIRTIWQEASNG